MRGSPDFMTARSSGSEALPMREGDFAATTTLCALPGGVACTSTSDSSGCSATRLSTRYWAYFSPGEGSGLGVAGASGACAYTGSATANNASKKTVKRAILRSSQVESEHRHQAGNGGRSRDHSLSSNSVATLDGRPE